VLTVDFCETKTTTRFVGTLSSVYSPRPPTHPSSHPPLSSLGCHNVPLLFQESRLEALKRQLLEDQKHHQKQIEQADQLLNPNSSTAAGGGAKSKSTPPKAGFAKEAEGFLQDWLHDDVNSVHKGKVLPCLALPCLALPCLALPCLALPCLALPCLALPCLAWPGLAWPCLALPGLAWPCLAFSRVVACLARSLLQFA
jgi:hypothetical protein